ncbi:flagellar basal body P-ring formation chaperone FlgA [Pandoraea commovens]|uniref:Flagella basal body P-ring formation protein FlgA n=1 Tax=Pandoraea commovens TaxID=2508289 RepID=A0A5E4TJF7_9BURK|nr:flagellar basal body P-ring formation chaperone FlgA [Pandoraea commovens]UVA79457.1 flagellar basal body P-ring formation chaperone FlgA [Pandoraea commovens]VVD87671.1 flagella basal body P-ring formation protein FlgA [Pandoraea commovens]
MAGKFGDPFANAPRTFGVQRPGQRSSAKMSPDFQILTSVRRGLMAAMLATVSMAGLVTSVQAATGANPGVATDPAAQNLGNTLGPSAIVIPGNNAAAGGVASNVPNMVRPATATANAPVYTQQAPVATAAPVQPQPQPQASQFQNTQVIRQTAERFLREQTTGLPGQVNITVGESVSDRMPACAALEPFLPPGARLWGTTSVGVRCAGERPWTLYLQARVSINATYFVAARQINPGETIGPTDLSPRQGDLTLLPRTVATDAGQIVGTVAVNRITSGLPIRSDLLRSAIAVQQGQTVRVVSRGSGFEVSTEGQVLSRASAGDPVQVRTRAGQVVSGTVKSGKNGNVEVEVAL